MKLLSALLLVLSSMSTVAASDRSLLSTIIDYADQIQNAVPTVPTTPMPTDSPTFSAAPSPRPSETPTNSPTVSMAPSISPTNAPTVSAAPTNFPTVSSAPSMKPSIHPSLAPSISPTKNPTLSPTISAAPSTVPSSEPSEKPSLNPSTQPTNVPSAFPSDSPSTVPSVSAAPSLLYTTTMHANILVPLPGMDSHMNATHVKVFESAARYFIQQNMHSVEGAVLISTVTVTNQSVVDGQLLVEIRVSAVYESLVHPDDFDFKAIVDEDFETNFAAFKSDLLDSQNPFFRPLDPSQKDNEEEEDESFGSSQGVYIAVIVCSIVASICAAIAACYAIRRSRKENEKGDKLSSEMNMYPDPVGSNLTQEDAGVPLSHTKSIEIIQVSDSPEKEETSDHEDDQESKETSSEKSSPHETPQKNKADSRLSGIETINGIGSKDGQVYTEVLHSLPSNASTISRATKPMSPNTMESGTRLGALAESILRSESFGSNRDPPTEANHYNVIYPPKLNNKTDPAAKYRTASFGAPRPEQRDDFGTRTSSGTSVKSRDPSVAGTQFIGVDALNSFFPGGRRDPEQRGASRDAGDRPSAERSSRPSTGFQSQNQPSRSNTRSDRALDWPSEPNQDQMQMTAGRDGRLRRGASRGQWNEPPSPASSAVSSSINAFLNMVGGTLGAAPLASSPVVKAQEKKEEKNEKFHDILQREGLYDVFAPSGALGIVVDTTKDGPAVHSLKQTSPMLGLINPGDLIVGLDAQDTRSMTAATLTRLMASKSNQKERKITLLAADNY